jgi:AraC family transcriptional regulator
MLRYLNEGERYYGNSPIQPAQQRFRWEFEAVLEGVCWPILRGEPIARHAAPCLWVFPADSLHGWGGRPGERALVRVAHFHEVPAELERAMAGRRCLVCGLRDNEVARVERVFLELQSIWRSPGELSSLISQKNMLELSLLMLRALNTEQTHPPRATDYARRKIQQAVAWYQQQMAEGPTVEEVARGVYLSPTHLRRLFLQVTGSPPLPYLRRLRLERAVELLSHTKLAVSEVSALLGFSEPAAFSRWFRQQTGRSPAQQRRTNGA